MTPAGTRVTWFVLGVCVGVVVAVVGMAGIAEAASRTAPDTVPAHSGTPQGLGTSATLVDPASSAVELYRSDGPVHDSTGGVPSQPAVSVEASEQSMTLVCAVPNDASGTGRGTESGCVPATFASVPAKLAGPLYSGTATWCAPTPKYCQSWGGDAMLGAVHSFRWGDEPYRVRVSYQGRSAVVTVVSFCACRNRSDAIDLSSAAFSRLAQLPLGRIPVEVEVLP